MVLTTVGDFLCHIVINGIFFIFYFLSCKDICYHFFMIACIPQFLSPSMTSYFWYSAFFLSQNYYYFKKMCAKSFDLMLKHGFVPFDSVDWQWNGLFQSSGLRIFCVLSSSCNRADDARQPLSRVVPIASSHLTPYRVVIILRLIILGFFLQYRVTHPVKDAYPLWLTSIICEIWFALSWLLDQFPKWSPINRETYLDRLGLRLVNFILFVMVYVLVWVLQMRK